MYIFVYKIINNVKQLSILKTDDLENFENFEIFDFNLNLINFIYSIEYDDIYFYFAWFPTLYKLKIDLWEWIKIIYLSDWKIDLNFNFYAWLFLSPFKIKIFNNYIIL